MRKRLHEAPESVDPSLYDNTDFKGHIVGNSDPLSDKINPSLLKDVDEAAKNANVKVSITTAVSGHGKGSRHETGHAVDIAMVNGKGFSGEKDAVNKGIYDDINRFVSELQRMGYIKNSESGNDIAVLTFGFPGHHHHVHVSRKSDDGVSDTTNSTEDSKETSKDDVETKVKDVLTKVGLDKKTPNQLSQDELIDAIAGILSPTLESTEITPIMEEINRFKQLIK